MPVVVQHLLALQAQDYAGAKWAVALRTRAAVTDADLERCLSRGSILRTHALRGTWQLVVPEDLRLLLALGAARVVARAARRYRELGLDGATLKKSNAALVRALESEGRHLTRAELAERLAAVSVRTTEQRLSHLLLHAELHALIVSGARRGKHTTHALFDERVPVSRAPFQRERALAELARRYFESRGPATLADFVWWSGLSPAEARLGLEAVRSKLALAVVGRETYHFSPRTTAPAASPLLLLPAFDEYLVAYRGRDAVLDPRRVARLNAGGGMLQPCIVADGRVVGSWRRDFRKDEVELELDWFAPPTSRALARAGTAARRYAAFLGLTLRASPRPRR